MPMGWTDCELAGRLVERVVRREAALVHARRRERGEPDDVADGEDVAAPRCGTGRRPRCARGSRPTGPPPARLSASVCPWRPAEYMTASAAIRLPDASRVTVPCVLLSTPATSSPNRNDTDRSRRWNFSDSATSGSHISSIAGRLSMTVTRVPSAANIDAYSMPMIPAPTTTIEFGHLLQREHAVGVEDRALVELHGVGPVRLGAGGDDDEPGGDLGAADAVVVEDAERVRVDERAGAAEDVDVVAQQLGADDLVLAADDVLRAREQVLHRDVGLHAVAGAVHLPLRHARQVHDRLAQRLARDGARVRRDAAHHVPALDDGDLVPQLRGGDRGLLPARAGADDDEVVVVALGDLEGAVAGHPRSLPANVASRESSG